MRIVCWQTCWLTILMEYQGMEDNAHEISYLVFFQKLRKMSSNLSSAAVVIGALRVNIIWESK